MIHPDLVARLPPPDRGSVEIDIAPSQLPNRADAVTGLVSQHQGQLEPPIHLCCDGQHGVVSIVGQHRPLRIPSLGLESPLSGFRSNTRPSFPKPPGQVV